MVTIVIDLKSSLLNRTLFYWTNAGNVVFSNVYIVKRPID